MFILLDIDGVMVTTPWWKKVPQLHDGFAEFNKTATSNLQRLISETGASIILTSSHKNSFSLEDWIKIFNNRGIKIETIDRLANNIFYLSRKEEILKWVDSDTYKENYVIIDDDKFLNDLPIEIKNRCVLTNWMIGLNEENTLKAVEILKNK